MPFYEYRCKRGHTFEVMQRMTDDPVTTCEVCQAPVQRVFHPVAVHFKGSGFYNTDYGKKSKGAAASSSDGSSSKSDSGAGDSKSSGDSKSGDSSSTGSSDSKKSSSASKSGD